MEPEYIRQDISATWEKLIKPTYSAHLFHQVSCTLSPQYRAKDISRTPDCWVNTAIIYFQLESGQLALGYN